MKPTIIDEVRMEMQKQKMKWGVQNHPILDPALLVCKGERMCSEYEIPPEKTAKWLVQQAVKFKRLTWMHILVEEVSEAASCQDNNQNLRKELIQIAAVVVNMVESLDRNGR